MKKNKSVSITIDVDTIDTLFPALRDYGTNDKTFVNGLQRFLDLFEKYGIKATLFVVGRDMLKEENVVIAKEFIAKGHEIANHTMNHIQGLRHLSYFEKLDEIIDAHDLLEEKTGVEIHGFRAPGWNADNDVLSILCENNLGYDSSIFPTIVTPLAKAIHYHKTKKLGILQRSTMGPFRFMFAPNKIHRTKLKVIKEFKPRKISEYPLTTVPFLRLPFFGTMVFEYGVSYFDFFYKIVRQKKFVNFSLHLAELTDNKNDFEPSIFSSGVRMGYIPKCLHMDIDKKIEILEHIFESFSKDFEFVTMYDAICDHEEIQFEKRRAKQGLHS